MVAHSAKPGGQFWRDCRIAVQVIGPQRWWETAAEYEALVYRVAELAAEHRGPQPGYRNDRPGYRG